METTLFDMLGCSFSVENGVKCTESPLFIKRGDQKSWIWPSPDSSEERQV